MFFGTHKSRCRRQKSEYQWIINIWKTITLIVCNTPSTDRQTEQWCGSVKFDTQGSGSISYHDKDSDIDKKDTDPEPDLVKRYGAGSRKMTLNKK